MALIRWFVGRIILLINFLFSPRAPQHSSELNAKLNDALQGMSLYQYPACPFCVKVRRAMKRNGIQLPLIDAKRDSVARKTLEQEGGRLMVPCLKIETSEGTQWMYESSDIIQYLEGIVLDCKRQSNVE